MKDEMKKAADVIAHQTDSDILLINAPLQRGLDNRLIGLLKKRLKYKNITVVLVTEGGDPDVAYRIARSLQDNYSDFTVIVSGYCKSAGTLLALGANTLVMSDYAELGPLDIQMKKEDDLGESQSGLTVPNALNALQSYSYMAFQEFFVETVKRSGGRITTKTASKIATDLVAGLYAPIFQQIDPLHIGEAARASSIAEHYGMRLLAKSKLAGKKGLQYLIAQYPSHGFVIDRKEAKSIFHNVRLPTDNEATLLTSLDDVAIWPVSQDEDNNAPDRILTFLNTERVVNLTAVDINQSKEKDDTERSSHEEPQRGKTLGGKVSKRVAEAAKTGS